MPKTEEGEPPVAEPASRNLMVMEEELSSFELTRSNSDGASSLSTENSGDTLHPSVDGRLDNCTAWTDEMHNKFLDSLEASFVQQLPRSRGLLACCKEHKRGDRVIPRRLPVSLNRASEQFAHLRDDGWQKMIFEKDQPLSCIAAIEIPWMHCQGLAEGSGQNFVDENCEDSSDVFPSAKRLKTAVEDA